LSVVHCHHNGERTGKVFPGSYNVAISRMMLSVSNVDGESVRVGSIGVEHDKIIESNCQRSFFIGSKWCLSDDLRRNIAFLDGNFHREGVTVRDSVVDLHAHVERAGKVMRGVYPVTIKRVVVSLVKRECEIVGIVVVRVIYLQHVEVRNYRYVHGGCDLMLSGDLWSYIGRWRRIVSTSIVSLTIVSSSVVTAIVRSSAVIPTCVFVPAAI